MKLFVIGIVGIFYYSDTFELIEKFFKNEIFHLFSYVQNWTGCEEL
jgi:hypothetical protein